MGGELLPNLFLCGIWIAQAGLQLGITSFADGKFVQAFFHYPELALCHIQSPTSSRENLNLWKSNGTTTQSRGHLRESMHFGIPDLL
jgi:hypothetical protein